MARKKEVAFIDCLEIAYAWNEHINHVAEYEDVYLFSCKEAKYDIGGPRMPVPIDKKTGKRIHFNDWIKSRGYREPICEFDIGVMTPDSVDFDTIGTHN